MGDGMDDDDGVQVTDGWCDGDDGMTDGQVMMMMTRDG